MARKKRQHTPIVPPVAGEVEELLFGADGEGDSASARLPISVPGGG